MNNIKKVLSLGIVILAFLFIAGFSVNKVEAATCTAEATGLWSAASTWDAGCNANTIPDSDDTVVIPSSFVVTVDAPGAVAGSVTFQDAAGSANGITISGTGTLVVDGVVAFSGGSGAAHSTLAVGDGDLTSEGITILDGAGTGDSVVSVGTGGTITVNGTGIAFSVTHVADAQLTATGTGAITIGGVTASLGINGTVSLSNTSTLTFTGTGAQTLAGYSYGNLTINKASGTATLAGNALVFGNLTVSSGTFSSSTHTLDITGGTNVSNGATFTHVSGAKVHNGNFIIDEGGTFTESGAATLTFYGHVTNNGTFTANTGVHTFAQDDRTINGTLLIPNVTFTGNYTNNGTLTITTLMEGTHTLTNGTNATLNIEADEVNSGLTAGATGNTVNYNLLGEQVVKIPTGTDYYNLSLGGNDIKTIPDIDVLNDLVLDPAISAVVLSDGSTTTTGGLKLGGSWKSAGTWGSTGSAATNQNNTYFAVANTGIITSTLSHTSNVINTSDDDNNSNGDDDDTTTTSDDEDEEDDTDGVTITLVEGCGNGNAFSAVNGKPCPTNITIVTPNQTVVFGYDFGTTLVKMGTKGEACKAWQKFFNDKANAGLIVDGWCGKLTVAAAKTWQASVGLTADGILGPMSRAKAMAQ